MRCTNRSQALRDDVLSKRQPLSLIHRVVQRPGVQALVAGLCGVLTQLAWLDERAFVASWIGLTLWIALTWSQPPHLAFRLWLWGGLVGLSVTYHWLPGMASRHLEVGTLSGLQVALLAVTWDAFRFGVFGYLVAWMRRWRPQNLIVWPFVWVALEWVWPHVFPWRLGHTQIGWLALCQIAEVSGVYGVSFLQMWAAACAAVLLRISLAAEHLSRRPTAIRNTTICALAIVVCVAWGTWRIQDIETAAAERPHLRIALVQPGEADDMLRELQTLSHATADEADLIVWGESSISSFSEDLESFGSADDVAAHARFQGIDARPCPGLDCPLLCAGGSFVSGGAPTGPYHNTAYLIDADETIIGRYHKRLLMPWGEYATGQQWIPGLRDLLSHRDPMIPGDSAAPLTLADGTRLGVLICYEDLQPRPARETVRERAQLLINLNNLTVFGRTKALDEHQQIARFRAIENRRALVRCGLVGRTSLVSVTGRIVQQATPYSEECLLVDVPLLDSETLFTRGGDRLPLAGLAIIVLWGWRRGRW